MSAFVTASTLTFVFGSLFLAPFAAFADPRSPTSPVKSNDPQ
ncbi:hypothetical protein ACFQMM_16445 [Saliphagus sp. GCM10025308]